MSETQDDLHLSYSLEAICMAERQLGKSLGAIVTEMQAETGVSITTLTEILAMGRLPRNGWILKGEPNAFGYKARLEAVELVKKYGTTRCAAWVGGALGEYLRTLAAGTAEAAA